MVKLLKHLGLGELFCIVPFCLLWLVTVFEGELGFSSFNQRLYELSKVERAVAEVSQYYGDEAAQEYSVFLINAMNLTLLFLPLGLFFGVHIANNRFKSGDASGDLREGIGTLVGCVIFLLGGLWYVFILESQLRPLSTSISSHEPGSFKAIWVYGIVASGVCCMAQGVSQLFFFTALKKRD